MQRPRTILDLDPDFLGSMLGHSVGQQAELLSCLNRLGPDEQQLQTLYNPEEMNVRFPEEEIDGNTVEHFLSEDDGRESYSDSSAEVGISPVSHPSDDPVLQQVVSALSTLSNEVSLLNISVERIAGQVSSLNNSLKTTHFELKEDLDKLRKSTLQSVDETRASLSSGDEFMKELCARLDSISAKFHHNSEFLVGMHVRRSETDATDSYLSSDEERVRKECIAEIMCRTELLKRNEEKESKMKQLYERIYDTSPLTRCILRCLQFKSKVRFIVDFDSFIVGGTKSTYVDPMGKRRVGFFDCTVTDLKEEAVYLAAKCVNSVSFQEVIGRFVMSLAEMCFGLVFRNVGLPYAGGDTHSRSRLIWGICEMKSGFGEDDFIFGGTLKSDPYYLTPKHQINVVAAVPGMVATFGATDGVLRARRTMRPITEYYEENVMPALLREVEVKPQVT